MADPRILVLPHPSPGHIKPFLSLAQLLSDAGLSVVFLSTDYNHRHIADLETLTSRFPTLHFQSISDGLPPHLPRDNLDPALYWSLRNGMQQRFRQFLQSDSSSESPHVSCIITDMLLSAPIEVAEELGIPVLCFCPYSARYLSLHFLIPKLLEESQIPYEDDDPMGEIYGEPPFEGLLRRKDLPGFWSSKTTSDQFSIPFINQTLATRRCSGLIFNTFEELEAPFLTYLSSIFSKIYTIGPLHALSRSRLGDGFSSSSLGGFWKEDQTCMSWLDSQPLRSVIFVSFGSTVKIKPEELTEIWHGLMNSEKPFVFVMRSSMVHGGEGEELMHKLKEETEKKKKVNGIIVQWAAQEKILNHGAVGGFVTHCGWNSTLESITAGVPMICWSVLGDQPSNAVCIEKTWKIGIEMEKCERSTVEKTIRAFMEDAEIQRSIEKLSKFANERAGQRGLSYRNIENLIEDINNLNTK